MMDVSKIANEIYDAVDHWQSDIKDSRDVREIYAEVLRKHVSNIDWPAEARKAAIAFHAQEIQRQGLKGVLLYDIAEMACEHAEALVYVMKRREAFGGQPAPGKEEA